MTARPFALGAILSVTTGLLLARMDQVHEQLNLVDLATVAAETPEGK